MTHWRHPDPFHWTKTVRVNDRRRNNALEAHKRRQKIINQLKEDIFMQLASCNDSVLDRWTLLAILLFTILSFLVLSASLVLADDLTTIKCPVPGESCKILILSPAEEKVLTGPNMILDSAAQGRSLELSGAVVYLKNRINSAPEGTVQPKVADKPPTTPAPQPAAPAPQPSATPQANAGGTSAPATAQPAAPQPAPAATPTPSPTPEKQVTLPAGSGNGATGQGQGGPAPRDAAK